MREAALRGRTGEALGTWAAAATGAAREQLVAALVRQVRRTPAPVWTALLLVATAEWLAPVAARFAEVAPAAEDVDATVVEALLGASLFVRNATGLTLTHAGATLRAECEGPMGALRGALASVRNDLAALEGSVRVALPRTFATFVCPPVLRAFAERHPDVILELELDDAATDPATAGWDASIRIGPLPPGDLRVRVLGEVRGVLVASPAYLARHGTPGPDTLAGHRGLIFRSSTFGARWEMIDPAGAPRASGYPQMN